MGRHSGHIVMDATLRSCDVDCYLILKNKLYLEGKGGLFEFLVIRLKEHGHVVVVLAEGARWWERDHKGELFTVKYIDPTYMIRALTVNATDNLHCTLLAHSTINGIMVGYTGFVIGPINGNYAYIPMEDVAQAKSPVGTKDHKWACVRSITAHPNFQFTT
ncbi:unnamed protein product [Lactuca virosa]|uniref:Phosphofructokinase domain-containing protein n=1 Tax=Lactuca virosa TaxID=75947 RepID=A0AAU9NQB1_9ASTR|nr:unnamed protein product [Lactuca virosa]